MCFCMRVRASACTTRCDARPSCCPTLSRSWSRFCLTHLLSLSPFNSRAFFPPAWPVQGAAAKIPVKGRHKNPANPPISFCLSASVIELPAERERGSSMKFCLSRLLDTGLRDLCAGWPYQTAVSVGPWDNHKLLAPPRTIWRLCRALQGLNLRTAGLCWGSGCWWL